MPRLLPLVLWLETAALIAFALGTQSLWLLPMAGFLALLAGLLSRGHAWGMPITLAAAGTWLWIFFGSLAPVPMGPLLSVHPIAALMLGAGLAFLQILSGLTTKGGATVRSALARLAVLAHFISAGVMLGSLYLGGVWHHWLAVAFAVLSLVLMADAVLRWVSRLYTPRRHWDTLVAPGAFFFYRWLGPEWRACLPEVARDEDFDLRLAEMWMWPTLRGALPALGFVTVVLVWLSTCLHEVPVGMAGVRHTLGTWEKKALLSGLHGSLPWPFGNIRPVDTARLREVVLGFRTDPGQPILWERAHYEGEQQSLVGAGDDFLSISVPVLYRVSDPVLHLRSSVDAEGLIRSLAQRALLNLTLRRPAHEIMTTAREELRRALHEDLQNALDERQCGLTVAEVYLRDIHPPVTVAPAFQEVVSALEEKEAALHEGESYRRDNQMRAQGDAKALLITAGSTAANRLLQAQGQAQRFDAQREAWAAAPLLYQWREGYRVLDETLSGAKKAIFDESLRGDMPMHVDLRKVLNPDFVDTVPARTQTLVPRPNRSLDEFDLDIEGYLRADQGEVPAPDFTPKDQDNLLKTDTPKS